MSKQRRIESCSLKPYLRDLTTSGKSIGEEISGQEQIGQESGSPTMALVFFPL